MTFPTDEQEKQILADVKVAEEVDGLLMGEPIVQKLCSHVKVLLAEYQIMKQVLKRKNELLKTAINLATEYQRLLERVRDNLNKIEYPYTLDYSQGYRDGQEYQANMIKEMLP